jgi:Zn/Cd-binding protein ZinT
MVTKWVFIEGTTNEDNGDLSEGFKVLFEQKLKGKMPKIKMGNGKGSTIDKFKHTVFKRNEASKRFLLVDLDGNKKEDDLKENELDKSKCFYMIQEMESWFISQSKDVLDKYYKTTISEKLAKKNAVDFNHPDEEITRCLRSLGREYEKVKDGVRMLKLLNLDKLMQDFPDVKNLVEELQKA